MILHRLVRLICKLILFCLGGTRTVYGGENLPQHGPLLVITNHMSVADSLLILMSAPLVKLHFLIGEKWEHYPVIKQISLGLGGIFIDRKKLDRRALRRALELLRGGALMGLAPEGGRSPIGQIVKPRHGAAYLATRQPVPILPVAIVNTDKLFHNALRFRRTPIEVHFGEPFELPPLDRRIRHKELDAYADYMMIRIAEQLPERYHGYYRHVEHPALAAALRGEDPWPYCLQWSGVEGNASTKQ